MDLWGISGPAFVDIYAGLVLVPALVGALLMWFTRRGHAAEPGYRLSTVYHVAYLAGGPDRVTETVVAAMIEREQLRVSRSGRLYNRPQLPVGLLESEAAKFAARLPKTTAFGLRVPMRTAPPMTALASELAGQGLVVLAATRRLILRGVLGLYVAVSGLGIARIIAEKSPFRPVDAQFFFLLLGCAVVATVETAKSTRKHTKNETTVAGTNVFERTKLDRSLVTGAAGAVATGGLSHYPDRALADALTSLVPVPRNQRRRKRSKMR
jgi:uncharacterized protein (TIGR04222 family)